MSDKLQSVADSRAIVQSRANVNVQLRLPQIGLARSRTGYLVRVRCREKGDRSVLGRIIHEAVIVCFREVDDR